MICMGPQQASDLPVCASVDFPLVTLLQAIHAFDRAAHAVELRQSRLQHEARLANKARMEQLPMEKLHWGRKYLSHEYGDDWNIYGGKSDILIALVHRCAPAPEDALGTACKATRLRVALHRCQPRILASRCACLLWRVSWARISVPLASVSCRLTPGSLVKSRILRHLQPHVQISVRA